MRNGDGNSIIFNLTNNKFKERNLDEFTASGLNDAHNLSTLIYIYTHTR